KLSDSFCYRHSNPHPNGIDNPICFWQGMSEQFGRSSVECYGGNLLIRLKFQHPHSSDTDSNDKTVRSQHSKRVRADEKASILSSSFDFMHEKGIFEVA